jgi:hypothetical protein
MKKGVKAIQGKKGIKVGVWENFNVTDWYAGTPVKQRTEAYVKWDLYYVENGKAPRKVLEKAEGRFRFKEAAVGRNFIVVGYMFTPELNNASAIKIKVVSNQNPDILSVTLLDAASKPITKPMSYGQKVNALVRTIGMVGHTLVISLWRKDDKSGVTLLQESSVIVGSKGMAHALFTLPANAEKLKLSITGNTSKEIFYVTAYALGELSSSEAIKMKEAGKTPILPPKRKKETKNHIEGKEKPKNSIPPVKKKLPIQKPEATPPVTTPPTTTVKGIKTVYITDINGQPIKGAFTGGVLRLNIISSGLVGKEIRVKLMEDDGGWLVDDVIIDKNFTIDKNSYPIHVTLNKIPKDLGDDMTEGNIQELYVDIEVLESEAHIKSNTVNVDVKSFKVDKLENITITEIESEKKDDKEECFCKKEENQFYWSNKLTCDQRKKVLQVCGELWGESKKKEKASELMSIMHLETGGSFSPSADNGVGYSGLIQFSDAAAASVGTTRTALKRMTFTEQMDYVKKYLEKKKTQLNTMTDLYLMVLKPNAVGQGKNPNFVLFDESIAVPNVPYNKSNLGKEPWVTKYGYTSNPSFMIEKDEYVKRMHETYSKGKMMRYGFIGGKTYVWEVAQVITNKYYNIGKPYVFRGKCENVIEEKKESKGGLPPWVEIAIQEEKKIIRESTHCSYIINEYETSTANHKLKKCSGNRNEAAWCAAFVNYCLKKSGHKSQDDPGAIWYSKVNKVKRGKNGPYETNEIWAKKYTKMYIGGIVVWKNNGHTAIVVGIDKTNPNNYLYLGGNQDDGVRFWSMPKTKIHQFCLIPDDYTNELKPLENIEPSDLSAKAIKYTEGGKTL